MFRSPAFQSIAPRVIAALAIACMSAVIARNAGGQPPVPPGSAGAVTLPAYRPPALALVHPAAGESVPQDRPVVVFRFAATEAGDPIDARSFAVTVDGESRSTLFQLAVTDAWGPLAPPVDGQPRIAAGAHRVVGRICSVRGTCAEVAAMVIVAPSSPAAPAKATVERKQALIDLLILAARKLISP